MENENSVKVFTFMIRGVGITGVGIFGIAANIMALCVLSRPQLKSSITFFLLALSISDLIFLISSVLIYGMVSISEFVETANSYSYTMSPEKRPWLVIINDTGMGRSKAVCLNYSTLRFTKFCSKYF